MDLEELIDSIDIVEYISQFVELEEKNGEYWGLSPFSDEKTPSFSVRRENNTFYCFSSGIGGNVFTFTKFYYQCDANKAVDILKKYAGCDGTEFIPRRRMAATMACRKYMKKQVRHKESKTKRFPDDCMSKYEKRDDKLAVWEAEGISREALDTFQVYYDSFSKGIPVEQRQPILLYVASNGGDVDAGFELIDAILASKTPVYTINLGYQYSMGFLIGLAGHKRYATQNAKFLMHDGSNLIWNSGTKAQDQMEFQKRVEQRIKQYVIAHSNVTSEEYDSKLRVEWYLFADEAKEKGFCDHILGIDCDMDEIV